MELNGFPEPTLRREPLSPLESGEPRGLLPVSVSRAGTVTPRRPRSKARASTPVDPADPACWSWSRFAWPRGLDQVKQMRVLRGWHATRCGICAVESELVVDHDHGSGWVRGLLCESCNQREGRARGADDVFARWRACPPAAMLGLRVVYESSHRGIALPMPHKQTGPLYLPEWAPQHQEWPPEPWLSLDASDDDPVGSMTRAELVAEVHRLRRKVAQVREALAS